MRRIELKMAMDASQNNQSSPLVDNWDDSQSILSVDSTISSVTMVTLDYVSGSADSSSTLFEHSSKDSHSMLLPTIRDQSPTSVSDLGRKNIKRFSSSMTRSSTDTIPVPPRRRAGNDMSFSSSSSSACSNSHGSSSIDNHSKASSSKKGVSVAGSSSTYNRALQRRKSLPAIQESQPQHAPIVFLDGSPCDLSNLTLGGGGSNNGPLSTAATASAAAPMVPPKSPYSDSGTADTAKRQGSASSTPNYPAVKDMPSALDVNDIFCQLDLRSNGSNNSGSTSGRPNNNNNNNTEDKRVRLEITPGNFVPIRGTTEIMDAVLHGRTVPCTCFGCGLSLVTLEDADMVVCYDCRSVSPVEAGTQGGGLGLGMRQADVAQERQQLLLRQQRQASRHQQQVARHHSQNSQDMKPRATPEMKEMQVPF